MSTPPNRVSTRILAPPAALLPLAPLLLLLLLTSAAGAPKAASKSGPPTPARAAPSTLAQYRSRVGAAVAPLQELAAFCEQLSEGEKPEVWTKEDFDPDLALQLPKRERATFERVRGLLPPKEKVERADSTIEVDNSWLYAALEEYRHASNNDKRARALRAAAERLRALDSRLAELEGVASAGHDKDGERGRLNAILRDPAFSRDVQRGGALQRLFRDILDWIARHLPSGPGIEPGTNPRASQLAQIIVLALCLAVLSYVGWRVWSRRARGLRALKLKRGPRVVLGERLEADQTPADLLDDAERLARAGDLRGAIRKAYIALLCELGDRGVVRLARHKTNSDYLDAVRRSAAPRLYTEMMPLTFDFELHWYGFRDASETDWNEFKARCRQALKSL
jgi:hypothetical protein